MNISIAVKPNAKQEKITKISDREYQLWVKAAPKEGKANQAVIELLSAYFALPKSRITIQRGAQAKRKLVSIQI